MEAVILSAGYGSRMGNIPKSLLKICGKEILYRTMKLLSECGVNKFYIVVNNIYRKDFEDFLKKHNFNAHLIINNNPERGNGYSLHIVKNHVKDRFILVMSDHIYTKEFIEDAIKGEGLIVDKYPKYVDIDEATKVKVKDGRVEKIGKELENFDAIDTGFFILDSGIFKITEELEKEKEIIEMREVVERAKLRVTFVNGKPWTDVDIPEDIKKAKRMLIETAVKGDKDGFISRYINRKISTKISYFLVDHFSPNTLTIWIFLFGILSALTVLYNPILGAILYQISSILDGVDGEIARARLETSKFGGYLDSILDRYVDGAFLSILAYKTLSSNLWFFIAMVALIGCIMISYTSERFRGAYGKDMYESIEILKKIPGKRDERIFFIMIMVILNLIKPMYLILAIYTNLRVAIMIYLSKKLV
ncbi:glucose-1-phosphate thymidylyltransferase-like protein [Methanocaldococcus villosus KIN24-T80]|uniref:Bifunctional IPC transferase and DIPP synthase n=1 Tax=Methanocaldococcus villosus KIN24-T80 TaxID=1069083 RepID=N6VUG1_9EURY|nr:bifunctional L-myo-inositol-1-phosphate cytidylyltransferase/CDP-L-myo-inositol myo-inositolphosphotransferase [Methanocaldococcus villosus]ENN96831.1 glucose-1-phosphate thymidylyltransferase-like protein [Methanocaldococcus villosus KIN24-T80]